MQVRCSGSPFGGMVKAETIVVAMENAYRPAELVIEAGVFECHGGIVGTQALAGIVSFDPE
jgi:hypothetical protein